MVNLSQDQKSLGRITVPIPQDEALDLAEQICNDLKLKIQDYNPDKCMIKGKTKMSLTKNKFAQKFWIFVKPAGSGSVIDVVYGAVGVTGVDAGPLIQPFYKKLNEQLRSPPEMETTVMQIKDEDLEKSANEIVSLDSNTVESSTGSLPTEFETTQIQSEENQQQTFVSPSQTISMTTNVPFMSIAQMKQLMSSKHDQTKAQWDKNGIVQFKDEGIVILQRMWGSQVQFLIACSQVTKEGYRLMAIDEGKTGSSGGFSGGVNAYFYFQKMDYVR